MQTLGECLATSLGTSGMSEDFHAKMSRLSWRKLMGVLSYLPPSTVLICAILEGSSGLIQIAMVSCADQNDVTAKAFLFGGTSSATTNLRMSSSTTAIWAAARLQICGSHGSACWKLLCTIIIPLGPDIMSFTQTQLGMAMNLVQQGCPRMA